MVREVAALRRSKERKSRLWEAWQVVGVMVAVVFDCQDNRRQSELARKREMEGKRAPRGLGQWEGATEVSRQAGKGQPGLREDI